jgi:hypothetical protein
MRASELLGKHKFTVNLPAAAAADATVILGVWRAPYKCVVNLLTHVPGSTITGADTNTAHLNVQLAAGTEIANRDYTNGVNGTPAAPLAVSLTGTTAQKTLAAGDALLFQREKVGTGLAFPNSVVEIEVIPKS